MKVYEQGVSLKSNLYFHTKSELAQTLYFYPLCTGHYYCDATYHVNRNSYNSYLLVYVVTGNGYVMCGKTEKAVTSGTIFLLDCYAPHQYGTHSGWEIFWVHFDGTLANNYFHTIAHEENCAILHPPDPQSARYNFEKLYLMFDKKGQVSEPIANKYLINTLTDFLTNRSKVPLQSSSISEQLLAYITDNLHLPLTLNELAKRASLSPYYFTRQFKKETGYTPHEYLIIARINAAKYYLKTTAKAIKEIAFLCGFCSEPSFCTTFKRIVGTTPLSYRKEAV